jgi:CheY-like chemotaxis protein
LRNLAISLHVLHELQSELWRSREYSRLFQLCNTDVIIFSLYSLTPNDATFHSEAMIMPQTQATAANPNPLHILLVDDDEFLLDLMKDTLLDLGATSVVLARNGIEGLKLFKQANPKPNLIICDLCMPQLGGMELLSHLSREACQAEVLIMSGHNLTPPKDQHWNLSNYSGPVLNLAEKLARIQGIKVRATFEKPITRVKVVDMLKAVGFAVSE